ncbi:hypothetical protein A3D84_05525 [Candidatus Woesebacteria bacterium RIFCSPHIGHO2_02_FULL_42_20]|uniref:Glycosyltransferase 2-like domain-containing protein n=1 Tax=Candidatus Woesebacteria bacterium RIFCSPHIGHO2_12_FULL_41_24 TaxID=1802510 RepID=A0A1F8AR71_9BACT|nr:MAG: hypothetical protein A2873_00190 [Candidatus Woesebacteria bacterium RIFCSPHIGHO2_01_FULL_42_80]OGM35503.1 MAG: hypothetical protein A3D84_05525 [Candidatus Woesebacteria bacterium RIFCSPHIGHO2_02_FULL_42_20]OGM54266.1 MAG: hypothetical protein A3E44_01915 [Candidatus Woesebacteria bacterium RIFCSPHIGHO2_12_FULL_41_24]OGM66283.1 MAG: hypothetical protein A2969_01675 [Candidatus Woesebacteria bacterium RIFCSPLOWO2_01_FULL_42_67]OGM70558.1 MAG: hypothetical protein A3I55_02210 [Candidatus
MLKFRAVVKISAIVTATPGYDDIAKLEKCLESIRYFADEIIFVINGESGELEKVAGRFKAIIYNHKFLNYVEPLRNFGIAKASHEWVLILDPDELLGSALIKKLRSVIKDSTLNYCLIPRKNMVFDSWLKHSRWWPDFNVRFFRKGKVTWSDEIHIPPATVGKGYEFPVKEEFAISHNHYNSVEEYLERLNRYTSVQAEGRISEGYKFKWQDLLRFPASEFLSRYFAGFGYKDGLHGLVLSVLQGFSEFVVYVKVWQKEGFKHIDVDPAEFIKQSKNQIKEYNWWCIQTLLKSASVPKKILLKTYRKLFLR